ncbi:FAD/NAD(P)-binding protein [Schauerella aestuarii]|uniref:FAD/NAD(P)-binding protein n=1 Tax=Schauerella aestuarii TaxID=2511204 RepID=UPI0013715F76|nr:NAD(P)/FAD-dependent oxidoreductase [Achromobacter aestuarii]MYZ44939.1 NAD(P)/FAD-dependent oxidoreductase [Achromobacter aestuarii]
MDDRSAAIAAHDADVARDLARLNYPPNNWMPATYAPDGRPMLDVLVVGAGMCGQTAAFALLREGVRHLRVIDSAPAGLEGPWGTFARMPTLRSPKHINGPDLGIPSLTFRAWFSARHGEATWDALYKIDRLDWLRYLLWVRQIVGVPVENGVRLRSLTLVPGGVQAELEHADRAETVVARRVVLALGRDGSGEARRLPFPSFHSDSADARARVFHSSDPIDFSALRGKHVAMLGAGSSAFDNAGTALEAGASSVTMYARRPHLPQVNKSKWSVFSGFMKGYAGLSDAQRWRFYTYILAQQAPPPHESVLRCQKHAGFSIRFSTPWRDLTADHTGVAITTDHGVTRYDAAILATGFAVDLPARAELAALRPHIAVWRDRVSTDEATRYAEAARFPYLGPGFELQENVPGSAPDIDRIHVFNWGSTMSHGALAGDIPGLATGALRLAEGVVRRLFAEDAERHYEALAAFEDPELLPTDYFVPREARSTRA